MSTTGSQAEWYLGPVSKAHNVLFDPFWIVLYALLHGILQVQVSLVSKKEIIC